MCFCRLGHLRVEGDKDVVHDFAGLREAGIDSELHVDAVLFQVTGQRIEPGKIVAVIVHAVEPGRRDDVADIRVETGIGKKRYAPGREFAERQLVLENKSQDTGIQAAVRRIQSR